MQGGESYIDDNGFARKSLFLKNHLPHRFFQIQIILNILGLALRSFSGRRDP